MRTLAGLGLQGADRDLMGATILGIKDYLLLSEGVENGDLQRLIDLIPDVRIVVRFYRPDRMGAPAETRASDDYRWLCARMTPEQRQRIIAIIPANELNLDCEHASAPYPDYWKSRIGYLTTNYWLTTWATIWRTLNANDVWKPQLWWPALAPGHNPPGTAPESEYDLIRDSMALYDYIGVHIYGPIDDEWNGSGRLRQIVDKINSLGEVGVLPKVITECNQVNYADLLRYASGFGIGTVYWFLWRGNPEHATYNLGPPWINGLAEYIAEGEQPMPEAWDRSKVWAAYRARLSVVPAFEKYLAYHPEFGNWIDDAEYDVGSYRLRGAAGGLVYARIGDWGNVRHATYLAALPLA